ncbi:MAG TPA: formylglycine-generating enzyme family protein [Chryseolinea sp.]|nr:formylglycine-generating enzyme family protein [Chryseolinea sp.]
MNYRKVSLYVYLLALLASCSSPNAKQESESPNSNVGMKLVPGGEFIMGTDEQESYAHERPAHHVKVKAFWIDETEVTNQQFKEFVDATGYITVAEKKPTWEELKKQVPPGTPKPHDSVLVAGSLVFDPPANPVSLDDYTQWWKWEKGVDWKHPEGPASTLEGRENHPVVHIAYDDALAYVKWKGKRLPTEAEWEFASRGGNEQQRYSWGNEVTPQGKLMANTFQGSFPVMNLREDGFGATSPVKSFPPNNYGLYDMIGNVWEWTSDWYDVNYFRTLSKSLANNPLGPDKPFDPNEPYAMKRVTKGGSFLCANDYCTNYRPSARQGTAFDSGQSHIGFRCVKDVE